MLSFIFSRAVFCTAPWQTERLEEATVHEELIIVGGSIQEDVRKAPAPHKCTRNVMDPRGERIDLNQIKQLSLK